MAKQKETQNVAAGEKIFTIPLREAYKKSERKRSPYAVRYVRDFVKNQAKTDDVRMGAELNKAIWARGMRKPARSVRIKIVMDGSVAKAELVGFEYKDFQVAPKAERKGAKEKLMERLGPKALQKEAEEKKIEGKEDKKEEKAEAKEEKKEK